jgi:hypothetical protein
MAAIGFTACEKETLVESIQPTQPTQLQGTREQLMDDFLSKLDQENYAYSSVVKVTDQSGKNSVQFKLYSNHKELYDNEVYRYQNAVMKRGPSIHTHIYSVNDYTANTFGLENLGVNEDGIEEAEELKNKIVIVTVESRLDRPTEWHLHFPQKANKVITLTEAGVYYQFYGYTKETKVTHHGNIGQVQTTQRLYMSWRPDVFFFYDTDLQTSSKPYFINRFYTTTSSFQGMRLNAHVRGVQVSVENWFR